MLKAHVLLSQIFDLFLQDIAAKVLLVQRLVVVLSAMVVLAGIGGGGQGGDAEGVENN